MNVNSFNDTVRHISKAYRQLDFNPKLIWIFYSTRFLNRGVVSLRCSYSILGSQSRHGVLSQRLIRAQ